MEDQNEEATYRHSGVVGGWGGRGARPIQFDDGGPPDPIAKIPILMKTVEEWQALPSFGGSSGSAKVQLVNVIGDPSKPGPYIQLEKVAPHVVIEAHHHAGDRTVTVIQGTLMFGNGPRALCI